VKPPGHDLVGTLHFSDLRENVAFTVRLVLLRTLAAAGFRFQFLSPLLHRGSFRFRELRGIPARCVVRGFLRGVPGA
jgi:hypothetical protein